MGIGCVSLLVLAPSAAVDASAASAYELGAECRSDELFGHERRAGLARMDPQSSLSDAGLPHSAACAIPGQHEPSMPCEWDSVRNVQHKRGAQ